ncbi:abortive infection family protein [Mesorhizobium sp. M0142]|uniref:abortive infection family protein n=1 Tax=unclassified Mesorhizobium TaxID=325217 RepID=UPI0033386FA2
MQTLRELIERHSDENSELRYYIPIIEKAERNEVQHPDICIECCASLFQGVSKTIVNRLDPPKDKKAFEDASIGQQVKRALKCLSVADDVIEIDFPRRVESLVQIIGQLRNQRGDISHGRAVPKELQSDRSLARLVVNLTEPVIRYMLASYFALQPERTVIPDYDANPAFNDYLDDKVPIEGKPLYSRALYAQFPEDYVIELKEYQEMAADPDLLLAEEGSDRGDAE